jgi:hypothetical protein
LKINRRIEKYKSDLILDRFQIQNQPKEGGKPIVLFTSPNETVEELKRKIKDKTGIPVDQQLLTTPRGKVLDDLKATTTLKEAGIQKGDTLGLDRMQITVTQPDGTTIPIYCGLNNTIQDIKDKIETETKIPPKEQILKTPGGTVLDDPKATLQDWESRTRMI